MFKVTVFFSASLSALILYKIQNRAKIANTKSICSRYSKRPILHFFKSYRGMCFNFQSFKTGVLLHWGD